MGFCAAGAYVFVFGGMDDKGACLDRNRVHSCPQSCSFCPEEYCTLLNSSSFTASLAQKRFDRFNDLLDAGNFLNDFYRYNINHLEWTRVNNSVVHDNFPSPRSNFGMTAVGNMIYVFGGNSSAGWFSILFLYSPTLFYVTLHTSSFKYNPAAVYRSVEFRLCTSKYFSTNERALLVLSNCRYDEVDKTKF